MTDSGSARGEVSSPSDPSPDSLDASPSLTLEDASADAPRRRGVVIGAVVASLLVVGAVGAVGAKLALGVGGKSLDAVNSLRPGGFGGQTPAPTSSELAQFYRDGYLLLTGKKDEQAVKSALERGALDTHSDFTADMAALGEAGVISGWLDQRRLMELAVAGQSRPAGIDDLLAMTGRQAMVVRFSPDYLEVAGLTRGGAAQAQPAPAKDLDTLPAGTTAFVSFTKGGEQVGRLWNVARGVLASASPQADEQLDKAGQQLGLTLPDDLQTLLGSQFDLVVADKTFATDGEPTMGVRVQTDTVKGEAVIANIERLLAQAGSPITLSRRSQDGRMIVAMPQQELDELWSRRSARSATRPPRRPTVTRCVCAWWSTDRRRTVGGPGATPGPPKPCR